MTRKCRYLKSAEMALQDYINYNNRRQNRIATSLQRLGRILASRKTNYKTAYDLRADAQELREIARSSKDKHRMRAVEGLRSLSKALKIVPSMTNVLRAEPTITELPGDNK